MGKVASCWPIVIIFQISQKKIIEAVSKNEKINFQERNPTSIVLNSVYEKYLARSG